MTTTTNRTGQLQRIQRRGYKRSSELSIWKHLVFLWGGGLILWPALTALFAFSHLPQSQAIVMTFIVGTANLFLGWIPAMFIFLINWGIRGWIDTVHDYRAARARLQTEAEYADLYSADLPATPGMSSTLTDEEMQAHWKAMNPYGCCMDHRDAQGYPSHGGPDCQHPDIY